MLSINPNMKQLVQRQLEERGTRTAGQPVRPVTTVKSKALHDLQFRASVEGHVFISDERESAGGTDAGPAPLRYFLAGIMMCHQVWCVKSAALADVRLENRKKSSAVQANTAPPSSRLRAPRASR